MHVWDRPALGSVAREASCRQVQALLAMVAAAAPAPVAHQPDGVDQADGSNGLDGSDRLEGADRDVVHEAVAVLVEEDGASEEEAVGVLQLLARTDDQDLVGVARVVVAAARERQRGIVAATD